MKCLRIIYVFAFFLHHCRCQLFLKQPTGPSHPCRRKCQDTEVKICHYDFQVEKFYTLGTACRNCLRNISDCYRVDCVPADGMPRIISTVNRQIPGPSIEVCEGDRIVVDVHNQMNQESTVIHWHGIHQRNTPFMDGVFGVTQCPIPPKGNFRYSFIADNPGTHFWHSHMESQRPDGMYGPLIVHPKNDPRSNLYDIELPEHVISISDWNRKSYDSIITSWLKANKSEFNSGPENLLINGKGRYWNDTIFGEATSTPIAAFQVQKGMRYRFRLINSFSQKCPVEFSIDGHKLLVISSDVDNFIPIEVDSILSTNGERYDFVLNANKSGGSYWIRLKGHYRFCEIFKAFQVAVLYYDDNDKIPEGQIGYDVSSTSEGTILNGEGLLLKKKSIPISEVQSLSGDGKLLTNVPDRVMYFEIGENTVNDPAIYHPPFYTIEEEPPLKRHYVTQINNISMELSSVPLLLSKTSTDFCNVSNTKHCNNSFCSCKHVVQVSKGTIADVILVSSTGVLGIHPFHLHGNAFRVLATKSVNGSLWVQDVKQMKDSGKLELNTRNPPLKDTVAVPGPGYVVLRVRFDNPGIWLFHCHVELHQILGMSLAFHVGDRRTFPSLPTGFPTCDDFMPSI